MEGLNQIRGLCESFKHTDFRYGTLYHVDYTELMKFVTVDSLISNIDLVLTDPPYNVNAKAKDQAKKDSSEVKESYNDFMDKDTYDRFISDFFYYVDQISNMLVVSPGHSNITLWHDIRIPSDYLFHHKADGQGFSRNARSNKTELYLVYGKVANGNRFATNTIKANINHRQRYGNHPHPKPPELYKKIVKQLEPTLVFDPMMGSGTTGLVCEELGIPWFGCEIKQSYIDDCIIPRINGAEVPLSKEGMREL